jgi:adenylate kinase family enzyme
MHRTNNNAGVPGSGEKMQAELLAKDAAFKMINVEHVIREKSKDQTYFHQEFLAECIENSLRAPTVLLVGLLEEKIKETAEGGKNWVGLWSSCSLASGCQDDGTRDCNDQSVQISE